MPIIVNIVQHICYMTGEKHTQIQNCKLMKYALTSYVYNYSCFVNILECVQQVYPVDCVWGHYSSGRTHNFVHTTGN